MKNSQYAGFVAAAAALASFNFAGSALAGDKFTITAIRPIPFAVESGADLADLLERLTAIFDRRGRNARSAIALLRCSSGRFGSGLKAIVAIASKLT